MLQESAAADGGAMTHANCKQLRYFTEALKHQLYFQVKDKCVYCFSLGSSGCCTQGETSTMSVHSVFFILLPIQQDAWQVTGTVLDINDIISRGARRPFQRITWKENSTSYMMKCDNYFDRGSRMLWGYRKMFLIQTRKKKKGRECFQKRSFLNQMSRREPGKKEKSMCNQSTKSQPIT